MGLLLIFCVLSLSGCSSGSRAEPEAGEHPDLRLRKLAEGVWLHTSWYTYPNGARFPSNGLAIEENGGLTLVDTAWGELRTVELVELLRERTGLEPLRAIVTHYHNDRAAGADYLESIGVEVFAHPLTQRLSIGAGAPVVDRVVEQIAEPGEARELGTLELFYPGPAHTRDNIVVWLPDRRILFGGCAVRALATSSAGNLTDADLENWPDAIRSVATRYPEVERVIPGHGEPGDGSLLEHTIQVVLNAAQ